MADEGQRSIVVLNLHNVGILKRNELKFRLVHKRMKGYLFFFSEKVMI